MSIAILFDTLKFVETLKKTGFDDTQARGLATAIREVQDSHLETLATRQDIQGLDIRVEAARAELDAKIEHTRLELDAKVELSKAELKRDIKEIDAKVELSKAELKRDIKEIDAKVELSKAELNAKIEVTKTELKRDIKQLDEKIDATRTDLKRDIKELEARMLGMFRETELRMTIRLGLMMMAMVGGLVGVMRIWPMSVQYVPATATMTQALPSPPEPVATPQPGL